MENLKIKVNNEAESKEAQELFFKLGYGFEGCKKKSVQDFEYIGVFYLYAYSDGDLTVSGDSSIFFNKKTHKELTAPQLQDMAQNNQESKMITLGQKENLKIRVFTEHHAKTVIELAKKLGYKERYPKSFKLTDGYVCLDGDKDIFKVRIAQAGSELNEFKEISMADLSLMTTPQHKEYLDPCNNYELIEWDGVFMVQDHWIEVPDGAEVATICQDYIIFWKDEKYSFSISEENKWCYKSCDDSRYFSMNEYMNEYGDVSILWQRTQDEPFLTPESVLHGVDATLAERQASYGDFEDVAYTTESLVDVLKKANYEKMTKEQKMALYMICSKMARLVNGNPAHKDSWHDIAGYSKLVEDSL